MNDDPANRLGVTQARKAPGLACIRGFVHAISGDDVAANTRFTRSSVDDVRV